MTGELTMQERVDAYLAERRCLGFELRGPGAQLRSFARFAYLSGHVGPLTTEIVLAWVKGEARNATPASWARRLNVLRPFAGHEMRLDPATEFPQSAIFGRAYQRLTPHIYTGDEITALLDAARRLQPTNSIRPMTYETVLGLIAATGLRVSEALKLQCGDVNITDRCLTVRMTKFAKSRHVPFHASVAAALDRYLAVRVRYAPSAPDAPFFVGASGRTPSKRQVHWTFQQLRRDVGIVARGAYDEVRIHDLRHTFICRRVQRWQAEGADIDNAIAALATYVGHAKVSDTYWYLTGIPDLMAVACSRFEAFAVEECCHG
ncbi:tyrosine-type recombinase/integrase [Sinorhizobium medicae]